MIEGNLKEAPAFLKETPASGSTVLYNGHVYGVEKVKYDFVNRSILIDLILFM